MTASCRAWPATADTPIASSYQGRAGLDPDDLSPAEARPLSRPSPPQRTREWNRPGDPVAVLGVSGLGHLGSSSRGASAGTIAVAAQQQALTATSGPPRLDYTGADVAEGPADRGGATTILATVNRAAAMSAAVGSLPLAAMVVVGASTTPCRSASR